MGIANQLDEKTSYFYKESYTKPAEVLNRMLLHSDTKLICKDKVIVASMCVDYVADTAYICDTMINPDNGTIETNLRELLIALNKDFQARKITTVVIVTASQASSKFEYEPFRLMIEEKLVEKQWGAQIVPANSDSSPLLVMGCKPTTFKKDETIALENYKKQLNLSTPDKFPAPTGYQSPNP